MHVVSCAHQYPTSTYGLSLVQRGRRGRGEGGGHPGDLLDGLVRVRVRVRVGVRVWAWVRVGLGLG